MGQTREDGFDQAQVVYMYLKVLNASGPTNNTVPKVGTLGKVGKVGKVHVIRGGEFEHAG